VLLSVENLSVRIGAIEPLTGLGLRVDRGQILGLVGESGSGKSLTAMAVMGLLPLIGGRVSAGRILFDGTDLAALPEAALRPYRGRRIALITQNPMTALDPAMRVGEQVDVMGRLHLGLGPEAARSRTIELLTQLRIPEAQAICDAYPHQLSGGMKQRIVIAIALAGEPELIVADEPTTALDVTVQAQIIHLLGELVRDRGLGMLLITHDMGVVAQVCDRVAVLYAGRLAESREVGALFARPLHPYTSALIGCIARDGTVPGSLHGIAGAVPSVANYPTGCRFHPRCPRAGDLCARQVPDLTELPDQGRLACHFPLERAHG